MATTTETTETPTLTLPESISHQSEIIQNAFKEYQKAVKEANTVHQDALKAAEKRFSASLNESFALGKKNISEAKKANKGKRTGPKREGTPAPPQELTAEGVKVVTDALGIVDKWVAERTKKKDIKDAGVQKNFDKIVGETLQMLKDAVANKAIARTKLPSLYTAVAEATGSFGVNDKGETSRNKFLTKHAIFKTIVTDQSLKEVQIMDLSKNTNFGRFFVPRNPASITKAAPAADEPAKAEGKKPVIKRGKAAAK